MVHTPSRSAVRHRAQSSGSAPGQPAASLDVRRLERRSCPPADATRCEGGASMRGSPHFTASTLRTAPTLMRGLVQATDDKHEHHPFPPSETLRPEFATNAQG